MATFLVTVDVSIFSAESGDTDNQKLSIALPVRDRLLLVKHLRKQLKTMSSAALNDASKNLRTPIKVLGTPALKYQGLDCILDVSNDYYTPLPKSMTCLTASIKAEYEQDLSHHSRSMQLYVHGLTGQKQSFICTPGMTVEHLKSKVEDAQGVPPGLLYLTYNSSPLVDHRTLSSYNMTQGSTVRASARLLGGSSGGIKFVDVSDPMGFSRIPWSTHAPAWRGAAPGLCIEGVCENTSCKAHGQMVIYNAGFTHFDLVYDVASKRCKCPMCNAAIKPVTCALNRCEWKYSGVKITSVGSSCISRPVQVSVESWKEAGDYYERFTHAPECQVQWSRLLLAVRVSRKSAKVSKTSVSSTSEVEDCCICCDEIASRYATDVIHTPCGHCFHKQCLKPWMQLGYRSCPHCKRDIRTIATCL